MTDLAVNLLSSAVVAGLLVFVARTWISERLRQSIQNEYARNLETYKASLKAQHDIALERLRADAAEARAVQEVATGSFRESHREGHQRRLRAIEELWQATLRIRAGIPSIVAIQDWLLREEYPQIFTDEKFAGELEDLTDQSIATASIDACQDVESSRPFVGEYLWSLFFMYRAVVGRFSVLIVFGKENGKIVHWSQDPGVRQLLEAVLTSNELDGVYRATDSGLGGIRRIIEAKILDAANRIISGEEASQLGLEQAQKIAAATSAVDLQSRGA